MPCGRKPQTLEHSFSKSAICVTQGQGEGPCYHRSSVVGCCDGAESLLPSSVPENDNMEYLYGSFIFDNSVDPAGIFCSPNLQLDSFSFQLNCSDFEVYP